MKNRKKQNEKRPTTSQMEKRCSSTCDTILFRNYLSEDDVVECNGCVYMQIRPRSEIRSNCWNETAEKPTSKTSSDCRPLDISAQPVLLNGGLRHSKFFFFFGPNDNAGLIIRRGCPFKKSSVKTILFSRERPNRHTFEIILSRLVRARNRKRENKPVGPRWK